MLIYLLLLVIIILLYKHINKIESFETNNKCAFCIPLHPKHFNFAYEILQQLNKNSDADIYFIFTTKKEMNTFKLNIPNTELLYYKSLVLDDFTQSKKLDENRSWVSVKKLYALSVLYKKYKYISCIDSEVMFIKKNNFYNVMNNIANNKIIIGGDITNSNNKDYKKIIKSSLTYIVPLNDIDKLKELSHNYTIYTWWSNLPVYDCSKAADFLDWIEFNNNSFLDKINWFVFDDLLYNYYLILKHNFKLAIIPELKASLEYGDHNIIQNVNNNICKIYWVNYSIYTKNTEYYDNQDFILVYHLDR
jgi:hypothetical protein